MMARTKVLPDHIAVAAGGSEPYAALYALDHGSAEKRLLKQLWDEARIRWLNGFKSRHTRRSYERGLQNFLTYIADRFAIDWPWLITGEHCAAWLQYMQTQGSAPSTINARFAAASSYYQHVAGVTKMVGGQELSLFIDAFGRRRDNPFRAPGIPRPKVRQYGSSSPIHYNVMFAIFTAIEQKLAITLADLRDYALLLTFYRTGWRSQEVLSMTWGSINKQEDNPGYVVQWRGKGDKSGKRALPERCYEAIVAYLRRDGRYLPGRADHIGPGDYIWRPLRTNGVANFANVKQRLDHNRHITASSANEILRRHLRRHYERQLRLSDLEPSELREEARRRASQYHIHSLRHSLARELYAATGDIYRVSRALNHANVETTKIYIESMQDPVDDYSELLLAKFGI